MRSTLLAVVMLSVPFAARAQPVPAPVWLTPGQRVEVTELADPGWARTAAVMGLVTAGLLMGATTVNELVLPHSEATLPTRLGLHAIGAVYGPITARGAGSARNLGDVHGSIGTRVFGWILYGLSLASIGLQLYARSTEAGSIPYGGFFSQGLSSLAIACFSIDGLVGASQADSINEKWSETASVRPAFTVTREGGATVGVTIVY